MRALRTVGVVLLLAGIGSAVLGIANGDIQVGLALIFIPYLYGSTTAGALAILLVFAGLTALVLGSLRSDRGTAEGKVDASLDAGNTEGKREFGGVVLIGPVPIVFGSSSRTALCALILAACAVMALMLLLLLRG